MNKKFVISNEDFVFESEFDSKESHFKNTNLKIINSNSKYILILKEIEKIFEKCKPLELYEHLIIRVENRLRDYDNTNYNSVLLSDKLNEYYNNLNVLFRKTLEPFVQNIKKTKINFDAIKPGEKWKYLNENKKREHVSDFIKEFKIIKKLENVEIDIIRIENYTDIFLSINGDVVIDQKNEICLDFEVFLKKKYEESLNIYLETMIDKNKGRRLKV